MRAQGSDSAAGWVGVLPAEIVSPRHNSFATHASHLEQFAVHVRNLPHTGAFMEIVDVLRTEEQLVAFRPEPGFQTDQRGMGGVGRGG